MQSPRVYEQLSDREKVTIIGALSIFVLIIWIVNSIPDTPTPVQHYVVSSETPKFQEIWSLNNIYYPGGSMLLTATGNDVFFLGRSDQYKRLYSIIQLDLMTGQVKRTIKVSRDVQTIASDDQFIYVGIRSDGKILRDDLDGAAQVVAYDLVSGTQVWSERFRGARSIASITPQGRRIFVTTPDAMNEYHYLDVSTGRIVSSSNEYDSAINNQQTKWWLRPTFPLLLNDGVYVGQTGMVGIVYGFEPEDRNLLWQSEDNTYSNVAVSDGIAYFLTGYAELVALNVHNGQVVGQIQLLPDVAQDQLPQYYPYNVAASGDIVVVYMGDSFQLFAFRFLP